jgi:hypothetical protein
MKISNKVNNQKLSSSLKHDSKKGRDNKMSKTDRNAKKQLRKFERNNF